MSQLTLDDFILGNNELIICSLSEGYHLLRITKNQTPSKFSDRVQLKLGEYDYLYERTREKNEIVTEFKGDIKIVSYRESAGH